jgi:iron complex outermembrane receptor protein
MQFRLHPFSAAFGAALVALCASPRAHAQTATEPSAIETIVITATSGAYRPKEAAKGTASAVAPTQASLAATQPQSIITREFIDLSVAPTAEFSRLVAIAPSLSGDSSNGPGLSESKITMRGFKDGEFNVTFDGIPWGDTNGPSHHSTSFFPAAIIGGAVVERGPGNASNIGFATFGGSIDLYSKKAALQPSASAFATVGTWNTALLGVGYESGRLADFGAATVQLNYQHMKSDGYLSHSPIRSDNLTVKLERSVFDNTVVTLFASYNDNEYHQPDVAVRTLGQVASFGKNYLLDGDPKSLNYEGYNISKKITDFEYLRLRTDWGSGWSTDNQLYTYYYDNKSISSDNAVWTGTPGAGADPRVTNSLTRTAIVGNIPGYEKLNHYRVYGDAFKAVNKSSLGTARVGVWYEYSTTNRHIYDLDLSTGLYNRKETAVNAATLTGTDRPIDSVGYEEHSTIHSLQPFAEFEWQATPTTTITPGVKAVRINRSMDSQVGQTTRILGAKADKDYSATLGFLTANQRLGDNLAVYGQYAQGYVIPSLSTFYIADASKNSTEPQTSTNYQLGIVGKADAMTWDVDIYRIDFKNKMVSNGLAGVNAAFVNLGGVTYQGAEAQMAYVLGGGLSVYANASVNKAQANDTKKQIAGAPDTTFAAGALYSQGALSGSLIYKRTGKVNQVNYSATAAAINGVAAFDYYQTKAYGSLDLGLSYALKDMGLFAKAVKLQLNVFNLLNDQSITAISAGKTLVLDTYTYQAPRSVQVSVKADF